MDKRVAGSSSISPSRTPYLLCLCFFFFSLYLSSELVGRLLVCLQVNHPHCCANSSLLSGPTARRGLRQRRCSPPLTPRVPRGGKRRRGGILVHRVALASRVASGDPVGLLVYFAAHRLAEALVPDAESAKRMHANLAVRALVDVADGVAAAANQCLPRWLNQIHGQPLAVTPEGRSLAWLFSAG